MAIRSPLSVGSLFDALFTTLPGLVYVLEETGEFVRWNRGYETLLGYSDEDVSRMHGLDIVATEDRERLDAFMRQSTPNDNDGISVRVRTRNGLFIPIRFTSSHVAIDNQVYFVGTGIDERPRLAAERAARESAKSYRTIFDATVDAQFILDAHGAIVDVDVPVQTLYGCSREEALNCVKERFGDGSEADNVAEFQRRVRNTLTEGPQVFEWHTRRTNGETLWTEVALRGVEIGGEQRVIASIHDITARKDTEAAHRTGEALFRQLFDGVADAFIIHDSSGSITDANAAATRCLGYSRTELRQMAINDIDAGIGPSKLQCIWTDVGNGNDVTVESLYRRKDGTTLPVDVHITTFPYGNERLILATARDISATKQAEAVSKTAERRLALAVSATADAIWEYNIETETSYYSPRWYEMLGYPGQNFAVTPDVWLKLCHPDDYQRTMVSLAIPFNTSDATFRDVEFRARKADGTWIWLLQRGSIVERDAQGHAKVLAGTIIDTTQRKTFARESAEWKQRYDLLTLAARQIVYDYRPSGEITWGGVVHELLGYEPEEMLGGLEQWLERIHPDDRQPAWDNVTHAEEKGQRFDLEYRYRCKNGDYLLVQDVGYPYFDAQGSVERYVGVLANITEQRRAEQERERLEESLRQAQKMESIGRLAGGIAHDFNNLLTAIGGNIQLILMDEEPSESAQELLVDASKAVDSAANLTRQLLTFSRKQVINPKVLNLNEIVLRVQKMLGRLLGEDVELRVSVVTGVGPVRIDEGQAEQILVNLAVNARDAMPDGGRLTVETANVTLDEAFCQNHVGVTPGQYVMLAVSDTGCGMSPEIQSHLFEPFFTTKSAGKGTGLGLSMVYGAVRQNNGSIEVISKVSEGTTFRIYLPRFDDTPLTTVVPTRESPTTGAETIVLVEDEEQVRHLAARILKRLGYHVLAFSGGKEALQVLAKNEGHIELLLTDVIMPEMNGRALADQARLMRPELKVLFASGYTEDAIVHHGVLDDGIDFIAKPYTINGLAQRVRAVLDRK